MSDAFYKANTHYCAECVGRKDLHVDGCSVPAKEAKLAKEATKAERAAKRKPKGD